MRDDETQDSGFREAGTWASQRYREELFLSRSRTSLANDESMLEHDFVSNSLSGNERNRMYLGGVEGFTDVTLVSGADDLSDGRSFGIIDFDQDGWLDIALMSLNRPRFKLFRNQMGGMIESNRPVRFQLIGGQTSGKSSEDWSNRDAIGAKVFVEYESGQRLVMHKQLGEGFASQNSQTLQIGCPDGDKVVRLVVHWPSGRKSDVKVQDDQAIMMIRETQSTEKP